MDAIATLIAMHVRNAIEDFHADPELGLTDEVMAKLNPVIRRAIWEVLVSLDSDDPKRQALLGFTQMSVPDYWEPPSDLPGVEL